MGDVTAFATWLVGSHIQTFREICVTSSINFIWEGLSPMYVWASYHVKVKRMEGTGSCLRKFKFGLYIARLYCQTWKGKNGSKKTLVTYWKLHEKTPNHSWYNEILCSEGRGVRCTSHLHLLTRFKVIRGLAVFLEILFLIVNAQKLKNRTLKTNILLDLCTMN